jgi:flagellar hook-associated protein 2
MRTSISQPVSGVTGDYKSAASIGITTGEGWESYQEGGKLYLDESKLREALAADPDALKTVFGTTGTTTAKQGIAVRLKAVMDAGKTSISDEAGLAGSDVSTGFLGERISEYSQQIYDLTLKMNDEETRYYNQFSAMESALQKLSAQSSWLSQQTGQSSSSSG